MPVSPSQVQELNRICCEEFACRNLLIQFKSVVLLVLILSGALTQGGHSVKSVKVMSEQEKHTEEGQESETADFTATRTEEEEYEFPKKLEDFEYTFNEEGHLEHIKTKEPFIFKVKDDHFFNQKRYEALGEVITEYVYNLLEKETGLEKVYVPVDPKEEDEARSFFFMSKDALTNSDKLLILIHGSGVVRAGQWARRLIINDCLDSGTQLPFIKKAMQDGHGVIVLNTNENTAMRKDGTESGIRDNESPEKHALYVWDHFVSKAAAKHIAIIAHSYGGIVTVWLTKDRKEEVLQRVYAIALTDSVHSLKQQEAKVVEFFMQNAKNWVSSDQPLDAEMPNFWRKDCPRVSAGTQRHEETSCKSINSIFKFLDEKLPSTGTGTNEEAKTELQESTTQADGQ